MGINPHSLTKDDFMLLLETHGSFTRMAAAVGANKATIARIADRFGVKSPSNKSTIAHKIKNVEQVVTPPSLPDDDIPAEEIISIMCKRFGKRKQHADAKKWMEFKVDTDQPIAVCWFGDPHIDDDGCNWPVLKEHIEICKNTEGMYGANIGDTTNNWVGRLARLYANQETSEATAHKLVQWFFQDSGVNWLIMLAGNHDAWQNMPFFRSLTTHICPMVDWRAQFKLVFKNGTECLIDASHDHKGHSQWNALHGQQKASTMGGVAHLYVAGHRHNWAMAKNQCPETGRIYDLVRTRGYKHIDHYADLHQFGSQSEGSSIVTVIDPRAAPVNMVKCFADVQEGADYLTYLREKYAVQTKSKKP